MRIIWVNLSKNNKISTGLEPSKYKVKRASQGSPHFVQNNRYGYQFEGERSGISGSLGERLLENSKLISEDEIISPLKTKQFKNFSKYLNVGSSISPPRSKDLISENQELIKSIKKSQDNLLNSTSKTWSKDNSRQIQSRYAASSLYEQEESDHLYNNQTFSTFGPENDAHHDLKYKDKNEDRIRPARGI